MDHEGRKTAVSYDGEDRSMNGLKTLALVAVAGICFLMAAPKAQARVSIDIGVAPACPYGYYDFAPYDCAPYGYYGPEWFSGGVFIGAGPWFHGPRHFHGHVDPRFGRDYAGPRPARGESPDPARRMDRIPHFKGGETHDGHERK